MIKQVNRTPIERDTLYNLITDYSNYDFTKEAAAVDLEIRTVAVKMAVAHRKVDRHVAAVVDDQVDAKPAVVLTRDLRLDADAFGLDDGCLLIPADLRIGFSGGRSENFAGAAAGREE